MGGDLTYRINHAIEGFKDFSMVNKTHDSAMTLNYGKVSLETQEWLWAGAFIVLGNRSRPKLRAWLTIQFGHFVKFCGEKWVSALCYEGDYALERKVNFLWFHDCILCLVLWLLHSYTSQPCHVLGFGCG